MTRSNLCGWFLAVLSPSTGGRCHPKEFTFSETGSNLHFVRRKTESTVTGQEEDAVHGHNSAYVRSGVRGRQRHEPNASYELWLYLNHLN